MDAAKAASKIFESIARYAASGQREFAREDFERLKELSARDPSRESIAELLAEAAFTMAVADRIDLSGGYLETIRTLRQQHPSLHAIALTEARTLFYIIMGLHAGISGSDPDDRRDIDFLCGEFNAIAKPFSGNSEIASFIQAVNQEVLRSGSGSS